MKRVLLRIYLALRSLVLRVLIEPLLRPGPDLPGEGEEAQIQKILIIRLDRIGDMVLSTPTLKTIKHAYPDSKITVLTSRANEAILLHNPNVAHVIEYDPALPLSQRITQILKLRDLKFDLAVDPYADYELWPALVSWLCGARERIGYASWGREAFFTLGAPKVDRSRHFVDLTLGALAPLGIVDQFRTPEIFITEHEELWAKNWLKREGFGNKPLVGIHPGAYYESQRWLPERFAEVAASVQMDGRANIVILGGPADVPLVRLIESKIHPRSLSDNASHVASHIANDIRKFLAILSCCDVLVCNNSGPLHMAVALGVPTLSTMGPTDSKRWMPVGAIHRVFRHAELKCIGCNLGKCPHAHHHCMETIGADQITNGIWETLRQRLKRHMQASDPAERAVA